MIYKLSGLKNPDSSTVTLVCPECRVVPNKAFGRHDKAELVRTLVCPKCQKILAEWITVADMNQELADFEKEIRKRF